MRRCKICGADNADDAHSCRECGILFTTVRDFAPHNSRLGVRYGRMRRLVLTAEIVFFAALAAFSGYLLVNVETSRVVNDYHEGLGRYVSCDSSSDSIVVDDEAAKESRKEPSGKWVGLQLAPRCLIVSNITEWLIPKVYEEIENDYSCMRKPPYDLGVEFTGNHEAWKVDWKGFLRRHPGISYYKDGDNRRMLVNDDVLFFGYSISENVLVFGSDGLQRIEISIFNKGVDGVKYTDVSTRDVVDAISKEMKCGPPTRTTLDDGDGKAVTRVKWEKGFPSVFADIGECLEDRSWGVEYLNFTLAINDEDLSSVSQDLQKNVKRCGHDIYIEGIPMVNQGRKGYCVPATISRVLKYYGHDCDMHKLALMMETDCGGGTKIGRGFSSLDRVADEFGLERNDYCNIKYDAAYRARYNEAARDCGERELLIEDFTVEEMVDGEAVNVRHYDWLVKAMDPDVKRKSMEYDRDGYAKFVDGIVLSINNGHPLLWSVNELLLFERNDESADSGHMRLIVGYNEDTDEILFSDSWGSGHELKRATMSDAWKATSFMSCLRPQ